MITLTLRDPDTSPYEFHILNPKWHEMEFVFVAVLWILATCACKIVFTKIKKQNEWINTVPESALQILLGLLLALLFYWTRLDVKFFVFDAHTFFAFLLPPIIFDAGYFMPNRELFGNFDGIMMFAVVGTVFNTFAIGICLAVLNELKWFSVETSTSEMLLFASLISAVDPVAVIAVFEEMHVNKPLFVTAFGEALFNDAISVVLFGIFKSFASTSTDSVSTFWDYFLGILAFFVVSLGGVLIGIVSAFGCGLATKFTENTPVISALLVFVVAYFGYVVSEIFSFSSIIAAAVCGMMVKQYLERNLSSSCLEAVSVMTRNFAISSESLTFILLGLATISTTHHWDTLFVASTIFLCVLFRFVAIFGLAAVLRIARNKTIPMNELLIMSCGGLRGAIAFGVVLSMPDSVRGKSMFVTATLAVIFFSVGLQGMFIRPLLRVLNVELDGAEAWKHAESIEMSSDVRLEESVNVSVDQQATSDRLGYHKFKKMFDYVNEQYLLPVLTANRGN
ncbi:unnamed protein product [Caenorhabditis sp. 36 PRJEB53466]|nr:unnamed protein product [Caenorhabditis sp. 36 PRJEB53466]